MNQLPLQRRTVRQTLPNLMLFAAPNLTCRTKQLTDSNAALLPYLTHQLGSAQNGAAFGTGLTDGKRSTRKNCHFSFSVHGWLTKHTCIKYP